MAGFRIPSIYFLSSYPTLANLKTRWFKMSLISYLHNWIIQTVTNVWILNHRRIFRISIAVENG